MSQQAKALEKAGGAMSCRRCHLARGIDAAGACRCCGLPQGGPLGCTKPPVLGGIITENNVYNVNKEEKT